MQACEPWCQPHMRDARFPGRLLATILAGSSGSWRKARSTFGVGHMKHFQVRWIVRMGAQGGSSLLVRVVPRPSLNSEGVNARRCIAGSQLAHPPQPQPSPVKPTCGSGRAWQSRASTPSTHSPCSRASRASSAPSAWAERNGVPMSRGVVGVRPRRRTTAQPESPRVRGCPYQCMCTRPRPAMHEEEAEAYAGPRGLVRSLRCAQTLPIYRKAT